MKAAAAFVHIGTLFYSCLRLTWPFNRRRIFMGVGVNRSHFDSVV
jgi:hypothetical protein